MFQAIYNRMRSLFYRLFDNPLMRRVVKNSSYLFSAIGVSAILSMLVSILTARLLGVAGVGILATIFTLTSVINKFVSFRMGELVIKYVGHYNETGDPQRAAAVFKAAALTEMLASFVAFALICLLAPLAATYLAKDPSLAPWFIIYGLIVIANLIAESSTGLLQIFDRYRRIAVLNVVQTLFTLLIIALAYVTQGVWLQTILSWLGVNTTAALGLSASLTYLTHNGLLQVLLAYLGGKTISAVGLTIAALVQAGRHWGGRWWTVSLSLLRPQRRELAHFAISTNISASLSLVNKDSELLWISLFRGPVEAGYYEIALNLIGLVQLPVSPLPQATYPELSREVAHKNWRSVRQVLRQGSMLAGAFTLTVALFLLIFGRPLILLLYKKPEFLPAYPALVILLVGFLFANTFYWNRVALLALGRPDFPTKVNLGLAIFKLTGILLFVPLYGYLASAALLSASYVIGVTITALKTRSLLGERIAAPEAIQQP